MDLPQFLEPLNQYPTGRIVGGKPTTIKNVPYQVSLQYDYVGSHYCGASIIAENWVLTAAHCMRGRSLKSLRVHAGIDDLGAKSGSVHQIEEAIIHENFSTSSNGVPRNDIALIRVKEAFKFDETRQPVPLFNDNEESKSGSYAVITGWGETKTRRAPTVLQIAKVPIVTKKECNDAYQRLGGLPEGQICAAYPEGGVDSCQGDSGGPLVIEARQAGIVSWGNGCGYPGYPGAYTEVASYRDWIRKNTGL